VSDDAQVGIAALEDWANLTDRERLEIEETADWLSNLRVLERTRGIAIDEGWIFYPPIPCAPPRSREDN
jgi:hypothetical protein